MDTSLEKVFYFIRSNEQLSEGEKEGLLKSLKAADRELQVLAFKLERTEKVKRTTSILLEETIAELEQKREAVEQTLSELKAAQAQLIQSEKMASVGLLTAGIAHELNNPINNIMLTAAMLQEDYSEIADAERLDMVNDLVEQADRAQKIIPQISVYNHLY